MIDEDPVSYGLSMKNTYNHKNKSILLSQLHYTDNILTHLNMQNCSFIHTSMSSIEANEIIKANIPDKLLDVSYRNLVVTLIWLVTATRPDIVQVSSIVLQFLEIYGFL